jgi:hypothetical protein
VKSAILIVGGYGVVGKRVGADLAPDYPGLVLLGGRTLTRAEQVAKTTGHGVRGRAIDIAVPSSIAPALEGGSVGISCIDQPGRPLLWAALERGLSYTDITPHLTELGRGAAYEKIDVAARASGARVVLGTGIVPGISNVMVRALANTLGGANAIETPLLLSASDEKGPASLDYLLQELSMSFVGLLDDLTSPLKERYAVSNDNVVRLIQPGAFEDRLTEILRGGARALLAQAVEAEVAEFLTAHADAPSSVAVSGDFPVKKRRNAVDELDDMIAGLLA